MFFFLKELENEIRHLSSKIVEEKKTRLTTTHEVKAWQAINTGLSQGYGILKKIIKKDAAPSNSSIAGNNTNNLNNTNGTNNGIINYGIIINCNHSNHSDTVI
jgi:hypothetical protein